MVKMMSCPKCGAGNSVERTFCYECGAKFDTVMIEGKDNQQKAVCRDCQHASVYPPLGKTMEHYEMWCYRQEKPVNPIATAQDCFEEGFSWNPHRSVG